MAEPDHRRVYEITRPHHKLLSLYLLRSVFSGPAFPIVFLPCFFKYETLRYRFDDQGLTMAWGLLWRREIYLTYARIQDIHLSRGIVQRWLGLATIDIQTAAGSASSEMSLVGLTEYELVRDFLYSRMRGARFGEEGEGRHAAAPRAEGDALALLGEIRDEVRGLREQIERGRA
jgi:membrane protein YdbS with pleckstrin-like domain